MGEKCDKCCKCSKLFHIIVLVILLMNTYFVAGIWCATSKCGVSGGGKICPITGESLSGYKGSVK